MENEICLRKLAQPLLGKWAVFIILTLGMEMSVGLYGFLVWFLQLYVIGLPTA